MRKIPNHLESKNLVPFKRRRNGYHLPGMAPEEADGLTDAVDPELRADEQSFVRHYLGYADTLLRNSAETLDPASLEQPAAAVPANVTEMPKPEEKQVEKTEKERVEPSADDGKHAA
ncbi:MAG TPA: hypothetical protein VFT65_01725 [Candidatus Angelobacter sp.]|nr:hypothetical protein [Candidatus Angelobacter sp.]